MSDLLIGLCLLIVLAIQVTILLKLRNQSNEQLVKEIDDQKDKIISFESKLELFPDLLKEKIAKSIEEQFTKFTHSIMDQMQKLIEKFGNFKNELTKSMGDSSQKTTNDLNTFKEEFRKSLSADFEKLTTNVEKKLDAINNKVQENLNDGFKKTNETFNNVIERLTKIDEAQKKIDSLSSNVVSLQDILTDKKSRGIFGEVQLNQILYAVFGEKNDKVYQTQYTLSNGKTVDAMLFAPEPTGNIAIDSKFPLENYKRLTDRTLSEAERKNAEKMFKNDVKKQIDDIADKYIIKGETAAHAVMFLPAEAIFAEINAYHSDLIQYAQRRNIWITSPTTFVAVLSTLQNVLNDIERRKYADIIQQEIIKLSEDFSRYRVRWDKLSSHIDTVQKDVKDIHTSTRKITSKFEKIAKVDLEKEGNLKGPLKTPLLKDTDGE
ncbi:MAG: DNA recombination protein RmuC [Candidatus Neomarinimicrobiota bacterium]|nr:MAG: DNA recombination protein RmuC [Candidatus Neomarinimicrobiota bacterium]